MAHLNDTPLLAPSTPFAPSPPVASASTVEDPPGPHAHPVHYTPGPFPPEDTSLANASLDAEDPNIAIVVAARAHAINQMYAAQLRATAQSVPTYRSPYAPSSSTFFAGIPPNELLRFLPPSRASSSLYSSIATPSSVSSASSATSATSAITVPAPDCTTPAAALVSVDSVTAAMAHIAVGGTDSLPTRFPGEEVPRRSLAAPPGLDIIADIADMPEAVILYLDHQRWDEAALEIIAAALRTSLPRNVVRFKCQLAKAGMSEWEAGSIWDEVKELDGSA